MENSKTARAFLALNAAFSLLIGAVFLIAAGFAADKLFVDLASWKTLSIRTLGFGLIIFGLDLIFMSTNRFVTKGQILLISIMDVGWVLGSAFLFATYGNLFSGFGKVTIVVVAICVTVFALGQYLGALTISERLSQATVTYEDGKIQAKVSRAVNAGSDVVWRVMNDHAGYADVAENITKVEVVEGDGIGMQRRCYGPKGENWLETCDLFEDGRAFGFCIHTEAEDYPYPISELHGKWSVEDHGVGSKFVINIEATPKGSVLVQTLFRLAGKRQFRATLADLADAWAARMEREVRVQF